MDHMREQNKELITVRESLQIELNKITEFYKSTKGDLEDTIDRLHSANRVRHELEVRLHAELEAGYRSKQTLDDKVANIEDLVSKIEYYDNQRKTDSQTNLDIQNQMEQLKRNFEFKETAQIERIEQLTDTLHQERDIREMWIGKFETEQRSSSSMTTQGMELKARMQDLELQFSNSEVKVRAQIDQLDVLQEQLSLSNAATNERQLELDAAKRDQVNQRNSHEAILGQKKDYISKLLLELETMRLSVKSIVDQEIMIAEDYRSRAYQSHLEITHQVVVIEIKDKIID